MPQLFLQWLVGVGRQLEARRCRVVHGRCVSAFAVRALPATGPRALGFRQQQRERRGLLIRLCEHSFVCGRQVSGDLHSGTVWPCFLAGGCPRDVPAELYLKLPVDGTLIAYILTIWSENIPLLGCARALVLQSDWMVESVSSLCRDEVTEWRAGLGFSRSFFHSVTYSVLTCRMETCAVLPRHALHERMRCTRKSPIERVPAWRRW